MDDEQNERSWWSSLSPLFERRRLQVEEAHSSTIPRMLVKVAVQLLAIYLVVMGLVWLLGQ